MLHTTHHTDITQHTTQHCSGNTFTYNPLPTFAGMSSRGRLTWANTSAGERLNSMASKEMLGCGMAPQQNTSEDPGSAGDMALAITNPPL
jgi:hypothetical protein